MNAIRLEFMYFQQGGRGRGGISSLTGKPLKLIDEFTLFGCNITSTEIDINIDIEKTWTVIDSSSIRGIYNLSEKIKRDFLWLNRYYSMDAPLAFKQKAKWELYKNAICRILNKYCKQHSHKTATAWPLTISPTKYNEQDMQDLKIIITTIKINCSKMCSCDLWPYKSHFFRSRKIK